MRDRRIGKEIRGSLVRQLCQGELAPEAICQFIPVATGSHLRAEMRLLVAPTTMPNSLLHRIVFFASVPYEKGSLVHEQRKLARTA